MKSLWTDTAQLPKFPQLNENTKTDVLIIGGGITGILTAYILHQQGVKTFSLKRSVFADIQHRTPRQKLHFNTV